MGVVFLDEQGRKRVGGVRGLLVLPPMAGGVREAVEIGRGRVGGCIPYRMFYAAWRLPLFVPPRTCDE